MNMTNKDILVLGLGITGISAVKALGTLSSNIYIVDEKSEENIRKNILPNTEFNYIEDIKGYDLGDIDFAIKSPGISPASELMKVVEESRIPVYTDIELAYRLSSESTFVAITGTNGKTTTTSLVGEIIRNSSQSVYITGNIGNGVLDYVTDSKKEDIYLIETSSFQLNNINKFKPNISLILNLSPDHIDWHGTYDNYIKAKENIFINQDEEDITILNYDDLYLRNLNNLKSKLVYFSTDNILESGYYIENNKLVENLYKKKNEIIDIEDIPLPGKHNLENVLASIAVTRSLGINIDIIRDTIKKFKAIEHRLEYVDTINGVNFYNDSKGTNVESSIKAIEAIDKPIILIAGGYDKNIEFDDFIESFDNKVNHMIVLGETKDKLIEASHRQNFRNTHEVETMEEAVRLAYRLSSQSYNILLSPACASWGMYSSYEDRGRDFKDLVNKIKEE